MDVTVSLSSDETDRVHLPIVNSWEGRGKFRWEGKGSGTITTTTLPLLSESSCPTINKISIGQSDNQCEIKQLGLFERIF